MSKPKLSLIIPVYNASPYLCQCLDSVLRQKGITWEAVCIDDGSVDGSGAILDEYASRDARFKVIHKHNEGCGRARNDGLSIVSGEWLGFLDADDVLLPRLFECFADAINQWNDADVFSFKSEMFSTELPKDKDEGLPFSIKSKVVDRLTLADAGWNFWCRFYRVDLARASGGFPAFRFGDDTLFLIRTMLKAKRIVSSNYIGYGYRQLDTSISHKPMSIEVIKTHPALMNEFLTTYNEDYSRVGDDLIKVWNNSATETFCGELLQQLPLSEREEGWLIWKRFAINWSMYEHLPLFQRIRLIVFRLMPFKIVAQIIFSLPNKLKRLGFHR